MLIPNMNDGYSFLGYLQDVLSKAIPGDAARPRGDAQLLAKFLPAGSLKSQIESATEGTELPQSLSFDTSSIVDLMTLVHQPTDFFSELANEFKSVSAEIKNLVMSPTPEHARALVEGFFGSNLAPLPIFGLRYSRSPRINSRSVFPSFQRSKTSSSQICRKAS
jgi:hypothetical protein